MYCRISEDSIGDHLGVRRQEEDCRELAEKRGWGIGEVFIDNDLSAYSGKPRPAYQRMLAEIRLGTIDGLLIYHLDRLTRTPRELEDFFEVCDGAQLKSMATVTGDIDLGTDDGRFHARIMGAVARKESDDKSRRIRRKHVELARDGKPMWGVAVPFGYRFDSTTKSLLPDDRAKEVRQMFERYSNGWSLKQISHGLNDCGVVGSRGKTRWHSSHVARMLDNPVYAGYRHHQGELTEGKWKPLVDRDLWERVQARRLITKKAAPSNRSRTGSNVLSGILFCSCGAPMWRSTSSDPKRSSYDCARASAKRRGDCPHGGVGAERVERVVRDEFLGRLSDLHEQRVRTAELEVPPEQDLDQRRAELERKIGRLIEMQMESPGPATSKVFKKKMAALEEELGAVERETAERSIGIADVTHRAERLKALRELASSLNGVWDAATREEKNSMLRLVVERVVVEEGRPKPIVIQWAPWISPRK